MKDFCYKVTYPVDEENSSLRAQVEELKDKLAKEKAAYKTLLKKQMDSDEMETIIEEALEIRALVLGLAEINEKAMIKIEHSVSRLFEIRDRLEV